jgi:hypothetical protein
MDGLLLLFYFGKLVIFIHVYIHIYCIYMIEAVDLNTRK